MVTYWSSGIRSQCSLYVPTLAVLAALASLPVFWTATAQAQTWLASPGSGDWNTAANWNPATVPNVWQPAWCLALPIRSAVSLSSGVAVGSIAFNGTTAYTLDLNGQLIMVNGRGLFQYLGPHAKHHRQWYARFQEQLPPRAKVILPTPCRELAPTAQFQNNSSLGAATFTVNTGGTLQMIDTYNGWPRTSHRHRRRC